MQYFFNEDEVEWIDHPRVKGGKSITLFTQKDQGAQATIGMVILPKGQINDWHDHGESDDVIYVQEGRAKAEIKDVGEFELKKGSHLLFPKHIKHRIFDITEDLKIYHIKAPATM